MHHEIFSGSYEPLSETFSQKKQWEKWIGAGLFTYQDSFLLFFSTTGNPSLTWGYFSSDQLDMHFCAQAIHVQVMSLSVF